MLAEMAGLALRRLPFKVIAICENLARFIEI
jgi:hypothetical protein